jgi:hypothetical protein
VAQGARGAQKEGSGLSFHPHPSRLNFLDLENLQRTISLSLSSESPPGILSHTFSNNPTNPTMAVVSGISKGFIIVGF